MNKQIQVLQKLEYQLTLFFTLLKTEKTYYCFQIKIVKPVDSKCMELNISFLEFSSIYMKEDQLPKSIKIEAPLLLKGFIIYKFSLEVGKDTPIYLFRNYLCPRFVRVLQRNRANRMWTYTEIYYKELAHTIMEAASTNLQCGAAGWRPRRADCTDEVGRQSAGKLPLAQGGQSFGLFRSSTDWMRPTHIMMGNPDLNINLIPKHPPRQQKINHYIPIQ